MAIKNVIKKHLTYVIGVALGDGNLSNPNKRAVRLRITCDTKYKKIIENIIKSIKIILPKNKVSIVKREKNYIDISCYSNKWESLLGWKVGLGSKYKQKISVPKWIINNKKFTLLCLRGLLETDGSIYLDRKYKMANFVTIIPSLAADVMTMIEKIGFKPNIQFFYYNYKRTKITIRVSKDVENFINLTKVKKI